MPVAKSKTRPGSFRKNFNRSRNEIKLTVGRSGPNDRKAPNTGDKEIATRRRVASVRPNEQPVLDYPNCLLLEGCCIRVESRLPGNLRGDRCKKDRWERTELLAAHLVVSE